MKAVIFEDGLIQIRLNDARDYENLKEGMLYFAVDKKNKVMILDDASEGLHFDGEKRTVRPIDIEEATHD